MLVLISATYFCIQTATARDEQLCGKLSLRLGFEEDKNKKKINSLKTTKLIMDWLPQERRKRGRSRKMWMEGVQAAMTTRNLEPDQWRNREEWRLVSGRRRQLFKKKPDR